MRVFIITISGVIVSFDIYIVLERPRSKVKRLS